MSSRGPAGLGRLADRLYADFLMPSRLDAYAGLLEAALEQGYEVHAVGSFWRLGELPGADPARRILVLRHDVDTDPATAGTLWQIDRQLGVRSSYFFRLGTFDPDLAGRVGSAGGEASYHYEELATIIKRRRIRTRNAALATLPEAQADFARNLERLRAATGLPMRVVASHGDFVNRRLAVANWEVLADPPFRARVGVELETYDDALLARLPRRFTDALHPRYWDPSDPLIAIRAGEPVVSVLVHPRHWRRNSVGNLRDDLRRLGEEMRFRRPGRS